MTFNPEKHHRRSIRLQGYDYSQAGAYFITIVTQDRMCLFGDVVDGQMRLSPLGEIVREEWLKTAQIRPYVRLCDDEFVVMRNHIYGIIWIINDDVGATRRVAPTKRPQGPEPHSVGAIIGQFKSATTKRINAVRGTPGGRVWQRNYYEHILRSEETLNRIRQYIADNPARWAFDRENPEAATPEPEGIWRH